MKILAINCKPLDLTYFTSRGLNIEVTYETCNEIFPLVAVKTGKDQFNNVIDFFSPFPTNYLENKYKTYQYSVILVGYDASKYDSKLSKTGGYTHEFPLSCGSFWATVRQDNFTNFYAIHELHHALVYILNVKFGLNKSNATMVRDFMDIDSNGKPYFLNNDIENTLSNHAQTWNQIKVQLNKLLSITYASEGYKYFSPAEVSKWKLTPELWKLLDKLRGECGFPFIITSGLRSVAQNASLSDAVGDSAHLSGLAVDLSVTDSGKRDKLLEVSFNNGITRRGIGDTFVHLDISKTLPQNKTWTYYK